MIHAAIRQGLSATLAALAVLIFGASLPASASDKSDAQALVAKSRATIQTLAKHPVFAALHAALLSKGVEQGAALSSDFVVYAKVKGAFAGVAVDGSVMDVHQALNRAYYGQDATPVEILVKRSVTSADAAGLRAAVAAAAR